MKLLITGYPGWLTHRFLETLDDYPEFSSQITFIRCLSEHPANLPPLKISAEVVEGNLLNPKSLQDAVAGMDLVFHAAGVLHVRRNKDFYLINRDGTRHLLEASAAGQIKRFLYISTNAAQGFCPGRGSELKEDDPCHPESHYGRSKYEAELAVQKFSGKNGMETVILRPAMFYGPPVAERHLDIYRRISRGTFPVFGSGDYLRSITYIDNLIQGVHLALHRKEASGQTYYIADRIIPTLNEIIDAIAKSMGAKVRILHYPKELAWIAGKLDSLIARMGFYWMLPHIVSESCKNIACQISKAEKELGYNPQIDFHEGYRRVMDWCRKNGKLA